MTKKQYTYQLTKIKYLISILSLILNAVGVFALFILGYFNQNSTEDLSFKNENLLWLLLLQIPLIFIYLKNLKDSNTLVEKTATNVRPYIFPSVNSRYSLIKFTLLLSAFIFIVLALAQPHYGKMKKSGSMKNMELVICLDISNSMNTKDVSAEFSRIEIAKRSLQQLINQLKGEKIGLCIFAGDAYPQLPITSDYNAAKMFINDIHTNMISNQGTNIAAALRLSRSMFSKQKNQKSIIIITDGENHEENPDNELKMLKENNIILSVLGIGTAKGGPVPNNPDRPELGYKMSSSGTTVISRLNPGFIKSIASKGNGIAVISNSEFPNINQLLTEINQIKRSKTRNLQFDMKQNQYQIPLALAILSWVLYLFVSRNWLEEHV